MVKRGRLRLSYISDKTKRKQTFKKRKKGIMKKLNELVTLCDVKACAVVVDPFTKQPFVGPSVEGVHEVVSEFLQLPGPQQTMRMMDHEGYLRDRIYREEARARKLAEENHKSQLRECVFGCLSGKIMLSNLDPRTLHDMWNFADGYIKELNCRVKNLTEGEGQGSSSSAPLVVAGDAPAVTAPLGFHDHVQYSHMNMNQIQYQQPFQSQAYVPPPSAASGVSPTIWDQTPLVVSNAETVSAQLGSSDHFQYHNQPGPDQYHADHAPADPVANMVPTGLPDTNPLAAVTHAPSGFNNHFHYSNMNMNWSQYESPTGLPDTNPLAVVTAPSGFHNHIHYSNMNMNSNQYESFQQYQAYVPPTAPNATPLAVTNGETVTTPFAFSDPFEYLNQYQQILDSAHVPPVANTVLPPADGVQYQGLVQHQAPVGFNDHQTQQMNYGMQSNQNMNLGFNQNQNWNQYPNQQQMETNQNWNQYPNQQQMENVGEYASIPTVDPNSYCYPQQPLTDHAIATTNHQASSSSTVVNEYTQKLKGIAYN